MAKALEREELPVSAPVIEPKRSRIDVMALAAGMLPQYCGRGPTTINPQYWRYRVMLARKSWQDSTRVTQAEFDAAASAVGEVLVR
jgi:hypothetical protein